MRLVDQLRSVPFSLVVRLPKNDPKLAQVALDAGADVLMVQLHVEHPSGGFGTLDEQLPAIESILALSDRPVGLMCGAGSLVTSDELQEAQALGIDFIAGHIAGIPSYALRMPFTIMAGLDHTFSPSDVATVHELAWVHCIKAAIVPAEGHGVPLTLADLMRYRQIAADSGKPVLVRTQRAITPDDLPLLAGAGVRGLVLDATVIGETSTELTHAVAAFRQARDVLKNA